MNIVKFRKAAPYISNIIIKLLGFVHISRCLKVAMPKYGKPGNISKRIVLLKYVRSSKKKPL